MIVNWAGVSQATVSICSRLSPCSCGTRSILNASSQTCTRERF